MSGEEFSCGLSRIAIVVCPHCTKLRTIFLTPESMESYRFPPVVTCPECFKQVELKDISTVVTAIYSTKYDDNHNS